MKINISSIQELTQMIDSVHGELDGLDRQRKVLKLKLDALQSKKAALETSTFKDMTGKLIKIIEHTGIDDLITYCFASKFTALDNGSLRIDGYFVSDSYGNQISIFRQSNFDMSSSEIEEADKEEVKQFINKGVKDIYKSLNIE